jgi:hypothetical protein
MEITPWGQGWTLLALLSAVALRDTRSGNIRQKYIANIVPILTIPIDALLYNPHI